MTWDEMRFDDPLDDVFAARSHVRVLRSLVLASTGQNLTGREVARRSRISPPQASRTLRRLAHQGLVIERRFGTYALYELNGGHVLAPAVRAMFDSEAISGERLFDFLARGLARGSSHVRAALLFGPAAWGEIEPDGELDLAILCAPGRETDVEMVAWRLADQVQRQFGNRLNPLVAARRDAIAWARRGRSPWPQIARDGVPILRTFPRVR